MPQMSSLWALFAHMLIIIEHICVQEVRKRYDEPRKQIDVFDDQYSSYSYSRNHNRLLIGSIKKNDSNDNDLNVSIEVVDTSRIFCINSGADETVMSPSQKHPYYALQPPDSTLKGPGGKKVKGMQIIPLRYKGRTSR